MSVNPFYYGRIVESAAFCNRSDELVELERVCRNSNSIFLYAERRLGKTSLIFKLLERLPKNEFVAVYIDLWPTYGEDSFTLTMAKEIAEAAGPNLEKLMEISKSLFSRLSPTVGTDDQGKPTVTFGMAAKKIDIPALEEVLEAPAKLANQLGKKCVVVFDEFQQILQYDQDIVERRLRSIIQHHKNVAYIFMGSRKHLIHDLFENNSRPLYRAAAHFPLGPIAVEHWTPFIWSRFHNAEKFISKELIGAICEKTEGHPFYTQHLCHVIWEITPTKEKVTAEIVTEATDLLLDRESYAFTTLFDTLTANQKRLLEAIAKEGEQAQPYEAEFVFRSGFKSASAVQSALKALIGLDIVDRTEGGNYMVTDRFLRLWIRRRINAD
ncbi:MAG: hypothetical protein K2X81_26840 [Candidatus Obscuribacterales bacterium]|nr:hypothetical protein [Candidatus Obscuribacterales bacterium]